MLTLSLKECTRCNLILPELRESRILVHFRSDHNLVVANGTSVMSYFSDAPLGTVHRMLYDDKIVKSPVHDLRDAEAIRLMASGELPPHTGMVETMDPRLRDSAM